jgi:hypothetical protein
MAFNFAQDHRGALAPGKDIETLVQEPLSFSEAEQALGAGRGIGRVHPELMCWFAPPVMIVADVHRHAVQPGAEVAMHVQSIPQQAQKNVLNRVLRILAPAQQAASSPLNCLMVGHDKRVKIRFPHIEFSCVRTSF